MPKRAASPVIQTSTTWADAGYDCDHCGGRILRRIDHETGLRDRACFQCEQCSCQWTLQRQPLRVGTTAACRAAQRDRATAAETNRGAVSRWLLMALGIVVVLGLLRLGGGALLRLSLPVLLTALIVFGVALYGRRRDLW